MGSELITFYRDKIRKNQKLAFGIAFIGFLLIHLYKITNTLYNHDAILNVYSNQDMTVSGRWLLQYACGISSYFDLPWVNGLLCAFYLGITAALVVSLFDIENPIVIGLASFILVATPCTTETMFFGFTADGYLFALMLCAIAAYLSARGKKLTHYIASAVLLCASLAIYQAYISFAIILCICYLADKLISKAVSAKDAWKWIGRHALIYSVAAIVYYAAWKLILLFTDQNAVNYQGIDKVGHISLSTVISGAVESVRNLLFFYLEWNILEHPITLYAVLNILFFAIFAVVLIASLISNKPCVGSTITILSILLACIPALSIWRFLFDGVAYRPMMLHGTCILYIFVIILTDKLTNKAKIFKSAVCVLMAAMIFNFGIMSNIAYFLQAECYEKSYYLGSEMMEDIAEVRDEKVSCIAFVGNRTENAAVYNRAYADQIHILSQILESDLLTDHTHTYAYLKKTFDLDIAAASPEKRNGLDDDPYVQKMPNWPEKGSVEIIEGVLVIKIGDIENE